MKNRFSKIQIETVKNILGSKFDVTQIARTGNIRVSDKENNNEYWVLYYRNNGKFLWRHIDAVTKNMHPLNMKYREKKVHEYNGYKWEVFVYNIESSEFVTFNEALSYFKNYLNKYKGIKI